MSVTRRETCRACGSSDLAEMFALGTHYVSDFVDPAEATVGYEGCIKAPIEIIRCHNCELVQQRWTVAPEILYKKGYWYHSSTTQTMRDALKDVTNAAQAFLALPSNNALKPLEVVLDIGSNDGTLLRMYPTNVLKIGVEPAQNLWGEGSRDIDLLIKDVWPPGGPDGEKFFDRYTGRCRIVTAIGMLYDLEDPLVFLQGVTNVLATDGIFIAQFMGLRQMLQAGDVGNLCIEHLEFYTLRSLGRLLGRAGLHIIDIEHNSINGGSMRLYISPRGGTVRPAKGAMERVAAAFTEGEQECSPGRVMYWCRRVQRNREEVRDFIHQCLRDDERVWVMGASTKGNTLLQWYGLDQTMIDGAADVALYKCGKLTVGTGISIHPNEVFRRVNPDYALILPYAFTEEFVKVEAEWLAQGGKFIVPLPELRVIGKG